jgi:LDH2 family malate/lactate/ureidoglycolate dehydrogenase
MLERFKVPVEDQVRVPVESLRETVTAVFEKMGVPPEDAAQGADTLVMTDVRGVETHGVSNMLRAYVDGYRTGKLNPKREWRIVKETQGSAVVDAEATLAIVYGPTYMRIAIEKARQAGTGLVTLFNSGHTGALGHHAMVAADQGMIGICTTATGTATVPTFGAEPKMGTNPIAFAAPSGQEAPLLFDAATTVVAGNKMGLAARVGATLLPGWIAETDGTPIMEETPVRERGAYYMLPFGTTREQGSHKGYAFNLMTEVFGMLSGSLPSMLDPESSAGDSFAAIDVSAFTDLGVFKRNMDKMLRSLRETKPAPGHDRVLYPGLSEHEEEADRRANGIPLHKEVIEWFGQITDELSIPPLRTM